MKRWIAGILAMCCLMAVLPAQIFAAGSTANVTKAVEEAAVPQASSTKLIALTFDDGPGPYTQKLLDGLAKRGVKVTFFVQGCNAEVYSDTLKREYNDGHQVANHTYNHPQLTKQSDAKVIWQVTKNAGILDKACGSGTSYILRPPYGDYNSHVLSLIGCPAVTWSVDPVDWRDRNATTVSDRIVAGAFDGAIVLVHDIHSTSVTGALDAVDRLLKQGYEFVTVNELFRRRGVTMKSGCLYTQCKPTGTQLPAISAPVVSQKKVTGGIQVSIKADAGTKIYYTTDGTLPNQKSKVYSGPFTVYESTNLNVVAAYNMDGSRSSTVSAAVTLPTVPEPEVTVNNGRVEIVNQYPEGDIIYTTDGTAAKLYGDVYWETIPVYAGALNYRVVGMGFSSPAYRLTVTADGNLLRDVYQSNWYYQNVDRALTLGLFSGTGHYNFAPKQKVTRAMFVMVLYRMGGSEKKGETPFTDVGKGSYYEDAVAWAYENKIVSGVSDTSFGPDQSITREQMCKMLDNFLLYEGKGQDAVLVPLDFTDAALVSDWAQVPVQRMQALGIISGKENHCFDPQGSATRAEACTVLVKTYDVLNAKNG